MAQATNAPTNTPYYTLTINYITTNNTTGFICTVMIHTSDRNNCFDTGCSIWDTLYRAGCNMINDRPKALTSVAAQEIDNRIREHNLERLAAKPRSN